MNHLLAEGLTKVVTYTTRAPRADEVEGVDYRFISEETFREYHTAGRFLEFNRTYGSSAYASPFELLDYDDATTAQVVELDPEGFFFLKSHSSRRVVGIFLLPPSIEEIDLRITLRSDDVDREARLVAAHQQIASAWQYDYVISNRELVTFLGDVTTVVAGVTSDSRGRYDLEQLMARIRLEGLRLDNPAK